jgi:hypothetical protein
MGTGAVYVSLSGIKARSDTLTHIETVFFFLNIALFLLNSSTLLIQAISMSNHHIFKKYRKILMHLQYILDNHSG